MSQLYNQLETLIIRTAKAVKWDAPLTLPMMEALTDYANSPRRINYPEPFRRKFYTGMIDAILSFNDEYDEDFHADYISKFEDLYSQDDVNEYVHLESERKFGKKPLSVEDRRYLMKNFFEVLTPDGCNPEDKFVLIIKLVLAYELHEETLADPATVQTNKSNVEE